MQFSLGMQSKENLETKSSRVRTSPLSHKPNVSPRKEIIVFASTPD
jgi:hypothetical protein